MLPTTRIRNTMLKQHQRTSSTYIQPGTAYANAHETDGTDGQMARMVAWKVKKGSKYLSHSEVGDIPKGKGRRVRCGHP